MIVDCQILGSAILKRTVLIFSTLAPGLLSSHLQDLLQYLAFQTVVGLVDGPGIVSCSKKLQK